jgi:hypothetical protein
MAVGEVLMASSLSLGFVCCYGGYLTPYASLMQCQVYHLFINKTHKDNDKERSHFNGPRQITHADFIK